MNDSVGITEMNFVVREEIRNYLLPAVVCAAVVGAAVVGASVVSIHDSSAKHPFLQAELQSSTWHTVT